MESRIIGICRYMGQDFDKVERWNLKKLFRVYSGLAKLIDKENGDS